METVKEGRKYSLKIWANGKREFASLKKMAEQDFIAGANWMREEMTQWHNPFVKDMPKDNVIVKYIAVGCPNKPYYTIGRREPSGWWDCENELATSQSRFEIVGWRPIHE